MPVKTKKPSSDDTISNNTIKSEGNKSEPSTSYEVFRNNTTAVEVVVKEVMNKHKNKLLLEPNGSLQTIRRLQEEMESLQYQLANSNSMLSKNRNGYKLIVLELKKQLDYVNRQELQKQRENLALLLENEKLKMLLESKMNSVSSLKRELSTMKKVLKSVIKSITYAPQVNDNCVLSSDPEFDDFERDMKRDFVKLVPHSIDGMGMTFDSSFSKDMKDSFDKHF